MTKTAQRILSLAATCSLLACGGSEQAPAAAAPEPAPAAQPAPAAGAEKPQAPAAAQQAVPEPAGPRVEDATFTLALEPSGPYSAGKVSSFTLSLKPRGEYHVNQEYPFSVAVSAPGLAFPKAELSKGDAAEFTENAIRLDVPFTPGAAGQHAVRANVKFAVCTPETCVPDERTLALAVTVE